MDKTPLILNGLFALAGALVGAPLVAKVNIGYAQRADLKETRRARVAEWRLLVLRSSTVGTQYAADNMKTNDFRDTNEFSSLEPLLDREASQALKELLGPYYLIGDERDNWPGLIRGNHEDALGILRSEIARIEREWGLI